MFTKSELILIHYVANGKADVQSLSESMGITHARVYDIIRSLKCKQILDCTRGVKLNSNALSMRLSALMRPSDRRADVLADSGLDILMEIREPSSVEDIMKKLDLSRATVFRRLGLAVSSGAAMKAGRSTYVLNDRMWPGLREMLDSLDDMRSVLDPRVVRVAVIYKNSRNEVLYSYQEETGDTKTAFSVFGEFGVEAWLDTIYYTTSPDQVGINKAFDDAFTISEKEDDYRLRLLLVLFYVCNESAIKADPAFLEIFGRIRGGEKIPRWPTIGDVKSRMEGGVVG